MNVVYSTAMKKESDEKKLFNISAFSSLERTGLSFEVIERRLLIKEFSSGEKLYIQYPGKETLQRGSRAPRPWDFRPKLQKSDGTWLKDLSFKDVWDDLYSLKDVNCDMSYVATLFFRIAYMLDSKLVTRTLSYEDIDSNGNVVNKGNIDLTWYEYAPEKTLLDEIHIPLDALRDCTLLPYLAFNDYLAQNEDCKYYYRAVHEKNEPWKTDTGRRNTLLTHVSVIAFIEGLLRFTEITDMFQRGMGVAPLPTRLWEEATNNRVSRQ